VGVLVGGFQFGVPEPQFDRVDRETLVQEPCGRRVAQIVEAKALGPLDPGTSNDVEPQPQWSQPQWSQRCFGVNHPWTESLAIAAGMADGQCGLTDGSVAGDWRLPNIREWNSLVDYGQAFPSLPPGHPFLNVQSIEYWSSTTNAIPHTQHVAWRINMASGHTGVGQKSNHGGWFWPVRGGQ